jgi:hypothetical protein
MTRSPLYALAGVAAATSLVLGAQTPGAQQQDGADVAGRIVDQPPRQAGHWEIKVVHYAGLLELIRVDHPSIHVCIDPRLRRRYRGSRGILPLCCRGAQVRTG